MKPLISEYADAVERSEGLSRRLLTRDVCAPGMLPLFRRPVAWPLPYLMNDKTRKLAAHATAIKTAVATHRSWPIPARACCPSDVGCSTTPRARAIASRGNF